MTSNTMMESGEHQSMEVTPIHKSETHRPSRVVPDNSGLLTMEKMNSSSFGETMF